MYINAYRNIVTYTYIIFLLLYPQVVLLKEGAEKVGKDMTGAERGGVCGGEPLKWQKL